MIIRRGFGGVVKKCYIMYIVWRGYGMEGLWYGGVMVWRGYGGFVACSTMALINGGGTAFPICMILSLFDPHMI